MLLCKKCHGEFDPEAELSRVLSGNEEIFWVCIFASDIGAPPKSGKDKAYYLDVETVSRWSIEDLPVRYGHTSEPIGRVLFGWHIHWDDKPAFACASLSTIKKVPFEAGAPLLLTAACQASLGTVNGTPDEISITLRGARDDTVGLFCSRNGLRELLTRFKFFNAASVEPIKRNCCRASNFLCSLMDTRSTATTSIEKQQPRPEPLVAMSTAAPTTVSSNPEPIPHAKCNEDEEAVLKVEDLAQQICELREKFQNQNEAMDLIRGLMEEWSVKAVGELKASEAPGTTKIRNDLDRMVSAGIIRMPDDGKQPKVDNGEAIRRLVEFNMNQFPVTMAKSFHDTIQNILEPTPRTSSSDSVDCSKEDTLPSIGTSLVAVRATALRAMANRQANTAHTTSAARPKVPAEKGMTPLQQIHHALSKNLAPRTRRYRSAFGNEYDEDLSDLLRMTPSKFQKLVKETVQDTMQDYTVVRKQKSREEVKEEEETKSALFEAFRHFLANKKQSQSLQPQQQPQQLQQPQQQHNAVSTVQPQFHPHQQQQQQHIQQIQADASTSNPIPSSSNTTVHVPEQASQTLHPQSIVRASGLSTPATPATESTALTLADLKIFY